jgi:hypothetical protein
MTVAVYIFVGIMSLAFILAAISLFKYEGGWGDYNYNECIHEDEDGWSGECDCI